MAPLSEAGTPVRSVTDVVRESFITGVAVVVPVLVTTFVFAVLFNTLYRYLALVAALFSVSNRITLVPGLVVSAELLLELAIPVVVLCGVFGVGFAVERSRYGEQAVDYFDRAATRIPGFGSIYESFRQMSDVVLSSDTESFREVKLVEFPHEGSYTLGFVTTETPDALAEPTPHDEMVTMFLPMAPNPVMGGHLVHLPTDRVMDVDLTVEEGVQTIVTSGVAIADSDLDGGLSGEEIRTLAAGEAVDRRTRPERATSFHRRPDHDRTARYRADVDPAHAGRPRDLAERGHDDHVDPDATRPAREADRASEARERTDTPPAERADRTHDERERTDDPPAERTGRESDEQEERE
ncbi:hypothetical protein C2R22_12095 [Salinigranum rubrum]|uniref:DUF502 domain-containing protein n=1 Tax=Salinigranum rubrum TaxID=755307 RepID=A0A2I8VK44_9EURY|nr:DUF502 domain-containing protein [Salinigranum rubrum]AUV82291.1 hypothetical protein C2R22_12095 [Salinigranum rubrum]